MKQCVRCSNQESKKWYKGPICSYCYHAARYSENRNKILASQDPQQKRDRSNARYLRKRKEILNASNEYYYLNKVEILKKRRTYYLQNKKRIIKNNVNYEAKRILEDIEYKLRKRVRARLKMAMRGHYKSGLAVEALGCSIVELKVYLENQFKPGMSWDNYGKAWEIDHKLALFSFDLTKRSQLLMACNFNNLQPLWKSEHYIKTQKDRAK